MFELIAAVCGLVPVAISLVILWKFSPIIFLKRDEQLLLETLSDKEVRNGPGQVFFMPLVSKATKRRATLLEELEYTVVTDKLTGTQHVEEGPKLVFLGAYASAAPSRPKVVLEKDEYVKLLDSKTGEMRVVRGPAVAVPSPTETAPHGKQKGVSLKRQEYVRLTDTSSGVVRVERGEQLVFPGPTEVLEAKQSAFKLQRNEYIKLLDVATGVVRVEIGEQIVFPSPTEDARSAHVQQAVDVNHDTAVLVLSKETGQQRLVTDRGLFFPGAHDEILEVRQLIRVEPHQVAIVQDNAGVYTFHSGASNGKGTAFFLPPHCELVTMHWGSGTSAEDVKNNVVRNMKSPAYKVPVTKIDLRAQYAFFEYNVRTADNVELVLEGTIFWQVLDVPKMIAATGDPKGDVWYHARGCLIQAVSRVTLEDFMSRFNEIVTEATSREGDEFYAERGVTVHVVEVTRYACIDSKTSAVLQEIIQETTNRINRMQHQQSENDVMKEKLSGEIEIEKQRTELIQAKSDNDRMKAIVEGEAEGLRLSKKAQAFLSVMTEALPDASASLDLFKLFEEQRTSTTHTQHLAGGRANLFLTPQDMQLKFNVAAANEG